MLCKKINYICFRSSRHMYLLDKNIRPIGPTGTMFASFIDAVFRQHIPITCDHWNPQDKSMDPSKDFVLMKYRYHIVVDVLALKYFYLSTLFLLFCRIFFLMLMIHARNMYLKLLGNYIDVFDLS